MINNLKKNDLSNELFFLFNSIIFLLLFSLKNYLLILV